MELIEKNKKLKELPIDIAKKVLETLKGYDKVYITFYNGEYHESVGFCILAEYPKDYKPIMEIRVEEIYTIEERQKNYEEVFGYKPYWSLEYIEKEKIKEKLNNL